MRPNDYNELKACYQTKNEYPVFSNSISIRAYCHVIKNHSAFRDCKRKTRISVSAVLPDSVFTCKPDGSMNLFQKGFRYFRLLMLIAKLLCCQWTGVSNSMWVAIWKLSRKSGLIRLNYSSHFILWYQTYVLPKALNVLGILGRCILGCPVFNSKKKRF